MTFYTRSVAFSLLLAFIVSPQASGQNRTDDKIVWSKVITLSEALIGEGGLVDAKGAEGKLDALIDLHVAFCDEMTGKRTSSQRVMAVKEGVRLFLKTAGKRYKGDKRKSILRILRDLATNRAVFIEILTSNSPSVVIEQRMLAYLERNQGMSYKEPVPIPKQVSVIQSDIPLQIIKDGIRLVSDSGTYGHYNKAVDAGEVITLNIPLKNVSNSPFRSTSGFLQTKDKYVRIGNSEVLYTERSEVDGQTVTFAPGKSITPRQHFIFTLSPNCPDGHKIDFTLLAWDSDRGKHKIPLTVTVYHVGPLDFGSLKIDDDIPGPSNGNDNDVMEPGETIEYVLSLQNRGSVLVTDISASLFTSSPMVKFQPRGDSLKYKKVEAKMERPISSSFVFVLGQNNPQTYSQQIEKMIKEKEAETDTTNLPRIHFRILMRGIARGHNYSWIQQGTHDVGVTDSFYEYILTSAQKEIDSNALKVARVLSHAMIEYRVNNSDKATTLLEKAQRFGKPAVANEKLRAISKQKTWNMRQIMLLLRQGGDINAIPGVLVFAVRFGYVDELSYLVEKGAKINAGDPKPLWWAMTKTQKNKLKTVAKLLELGANPSGRFKTNTDTLGKTWYGTTPLCEAVDQGPDMVQLLLQYKANPNEAKFQRKNELTSRGPKESWEYQTPMAMATSGMRRAKGDDVDKYRRIIRLLKDAGAK